LSGTTGTAGVGVGVVTTGIGVVAGVDVSTGVVGTIGVVVDGVDGVEMDGVELDNEAVVTLVRVCVVTAVTHH
jgi:hypothetical protein